MGDPARAPRGPRDGTALLVDRRRELDRDHSIRAIGKHGPCGDPERPPRSDRAVRGLSGADLPADPQEDRLGRSRMRGVP